MAGFKITNSISRLTEWITSIDHRHHSAGFKHILEQQQIFLFDVAVSIIPIFLLPVIDTDAFKEASWNKRDRLVNPATAQIPLGLSTR